MDRSKSSFRLWCTSFLHSSIKSMFDPWEFSSSSPCHRMNFELEWDLQLQHFKVQGVSKRCTQFEIAVSLQLCPSFWNTPYNKGLPDAPTMCPCCGCRGEMWDLSVCPWECSLICLICIAQSVCLPCIELSVCLPCVAVANPPAELWAPTLGWEAERS